MAGRDPLPELVGLVASVCRWRCQPLACPVGCACVSSVLLPLLVLCRGLYQHGQREPVPEVVGLVASLHLAAGHGITKQGIHTGLPALPTGAQRDQHINIDPHC